MVEVVVLSDDLAILDRVDVGDADVGVDAACPATDPPVHAGDNAVSRPKELFRDRFVLTLPRLPQAFEEATDRGPALEGPRLHPRWWRRHLRVGRVQLDEGVEVATVPGVEPAAHCRQGLV